MKPIKLSPTIFGEPVLRKDFFGREDLLKFLHERAENLKNGYRQNLALLGKELVGKSSCIHNFLFELDSNSAKILPIYIEIAQIPLPDLFRKFIGSGLYAYLKTKSLKPKDDLNYLMKHCRKFIPKTVDVAKRIERHIKRKDYTEAFSLLMDLPGLIRQESGKTCIVILEQFHNLKFLKIHKPFSMLGKKIMTQKDVLYIITSSSISSARQILAEDLSLLFGNFEVVELNEFDFNTSRTFITKNLEPVKIPEKHLRFLVSFTDGHPFYLNLICQELKQLRQANNRLSTQAMLQALDNLLYKPRGILNFYFNSKLDLLGVNKIASDSIAILLALASGRNRIAEICEVTHTTRRTLSRSLAALQELDVVLKSGSFYRFNDKVFRFWIKTVYNKQRKSVCLDNNLKRMDFICEFKKNFSKFTIESKKDLYLKVVDLFKSFKNERIALGEKTFLMPHFQEIGTKFIGANGPYIIGRARDKNWLCQIRGREVTENQISQILQDCKKGKYKFDRKVLVTLDEMDENAKLAAKEAKIWIWDLVTLNFILDLYGQHQVMRP